MAKRSGRRIDPNRKQFTVFAWHYYDDDIAGSEAAADLTFAGLPARVTQARVTHYRIDADHSNAFAVWQKMGSPVAPTKARYAQLEAAGELAQPAGTTETATIANGTTTLKFSLPRQAVSLVLLEWQWGRPGFNPEDFIARSSSGRAWSATCPESPGRGTPCRFCVTTG